MRIEKELEFLDARCVAFGEDLRNRYNRARELYYKTGHSGALSEYEILKGILRDFEEADLRAISVKHFLKDENYEKRYSVEELEKIISH